MASLTEITRHCDQILQTAAFADDPRAGNGLQVENAGEVTKIAAAVDACGFTIDAAAASGCDLLVVHHGLFWQNFTPVTAQRHRLLRRLFAGGLAVYSSHLPLDAHPQLGNNALLCAALGFEHTAPFFEHQGRPIGLRTQAELPRAELIARLERAVGRMIRVCPGGPSIGREIGVVTGGAGPELHAMVAAGIDTFITGEGPHWTFPAAEDLGLNLLYGGHYATETFGVRALAAHLSEHFGVPWEFIDHPSGL